MWIYQGKELQESEIPTKAIGFIYVITSPDGRKYLGRKMLKSSKTKTTKGIKKKIKVDSDWRDYWSSSPELLEMIKEQGTDGFKKEIILFAFTKAEMLYAEESLLYHVNALLDDNWINSNIRSKIFKSWFQKNKTEFISSILNTRNKLIV